MGKLYGLELRCPKCGRLGEIVVDDGPPFTVERLPSHFRVVKEASTREDTKIGCQCGEIFGLPSLNDQF
jgi:hypothetical protein